MSDSTSRPPLTDVEFLLCCLDSIPNDQINYPAVAKAANYANNRRVRARLSRIHSKNNTRPCVLSDGSSMEDAEEDASDAIKDSDVTKPLSKKEEATAEKKTKKVRFGDDDVRESGVRVTRSTAAKYLASGDGSIIMNSKTKYRSSFLG